MRKARSIRRQIRQIVIQGNQREIQNLFHEIYQAHADEFREDNRPTLDGFLRENLQNASDKVWNAMPGYKESGETVTQQLKAEIAALAQAMPLTVSRCSSEIYKSILRRLRQLSAV